jgi:hypothetical protein
LDPQGGDAIISGATAFEDSHQLISLTKGYTGKEGTEHVQRKFARFSKLLKGSVMVYTTTANQSDQRQKW